MAVSEKLRGYASLFTNIPFRRLFSGRIISLVGDNLYLVAAMWLVYDLTNSTFFTGLAAFLGRVPTTLSFLTGPIVDSRNPRFILTVTELVQMTIVLLVPLAAVFGMLDIFVVLTVIPLVALSNQFSGPAQEAALPRIVDDNHLVKANSLFTLTRRGMEAGSKAVAGFLVSLVGAVAIFVLNAATFLIGAVAFSLVNVPDLETATHPSDQEYDTYRDRFDQYVKNLTEGISTITGSVVLYIVLGTAIANFLAGLSIAVLPAYAASLAEPSGSIVQIAGPSTYGVLYAGVGFGLFVGAAISSGFEKLSFGAVSVLLFFWTGGAWVSGVLLHSLFITVTLYTLAWVPIGVYNILSISILQKGVPDELLGRVMATSSSVSGILTAGGVLLGGAAGEVFSSSWVMLLSGGGFFFFGLYWLLLPNARSIRPMTELENGVFRIESTKDD